MLPNFHFFPFLLCGQDERGEEDGWACSQMPNHLNTWRLGCQLDIILKTAMWISGFDSSETVAFTASRLKKSSQGP